jgi:superfamily II DNA or RNA helicase
MEEFKRTIKTRYKNSGSTSIGLDFISKSLTHAKTYKRAVGYFSSSAMMFWVERLSELESLENLKIKLMCSTEGITSKEDLEAISKAISPEERNLIVTEAIDQVFENLLQLNPRKNQGDSEDCRKLLSWIIANNILEIRFALPTHIDNAGMFHNKIGIFELEDGTKVSFTGSANETIHGGFRNGETISVFRSWFEGRESQEVLAVDQEFELEWNEKNPELAILKLSEETLNKIKAVAPKTRPSFSKAQRIVPPTPSKWRHQDEALQIFVAKKRGIIEMATGTGKTRTSLKIFKYLFEQGQVDGLIVSTDGNDLLNQWGYELQDFFRDNHLEINLYKHYESHKDAAEYSHNTNNSAMLCSWEGLNIVLGRVDKLKANKIMIIHDEVHGFARNENRTNLRGKQKHFPYILGLSATPERTYDGDGNRFTEEEIGPIIFQFGIEKAIQRGILCEFDYETISYDLLDEEKQKLAKLRQSLSIKQQKGEDTESIVREISRIYKTAERKIPLFDDYLKNDQSILNACMIFVEDMEYGAKVGAIIHKYRLDFKTYYSGEDSIHLERFSNGELECLISCKKLSQGIDIKRVKNVILFSSDRVKLVTIQRIGRCLRTDPSNPDKRSFVLDFVKVEKPSFDPDVERMAWLEEMSEVKREA